MQLAVSFPKVDRMISYATLLIQLCDKRVNAGLHVIANGRYVNET